MKINILGTEYTVTVKKYNEDEVFERRSIDGYCDSLAKQIVVCDMSTYKGWEHEPPETIRAAQKEILRHEVKELEYAPKWDGHTPEQAIKRIHSLSGIGGGTT